MGCDIHSHVEVFRNGNWVNASAYTQSGDDGEYERIEPVMSRHYFLFSQLAGVRSRNDDPSPISLPRGLPGDISQQTQHDVEYWGADGHSHSWLTLTEMVNYNSTLSEEHRVMGNLMHTMRQLGQMFWEYDDSYIRLVFWFDN